MLEPNAAAVPELTVSVRQLANRPGTSRQLTVNFDAAEAIGTEVIGVPEGQPVSLELLLESVLEGVLATGTVRSTARGECGRCLEELSVPTEVTFQELFEFSEPARAGEAPAEDQLMVIDDTIDLTVPVRDAIVLSLPFRPLCREDCAGLCPQCGARLADEPGHAHRTVDPRWAALQDLLEDEREEI
ncbi:MAG: DUF177 domain-containing protein [Bifidobacteriaceae bacterium]|jgi:uncharacterized protein|nr:DUF177 domain-containing protein [Bifidobacteriaceae bacterium]